jgi:hypothetical protein
MGDEPTRETDLRHLGRIAGVLFIAASLVSIPSGLLIEPPPPLSDHLVACAGVAFGIACLLAPWERMPLASLHAVIVAGIVLVGIGIQVFGEDDYAFFYAVVGIFAAYAAPSRRALAVYLTLITIALFLPLVWDSGDTRTEARHALVTFPVLILGTVVVYSQRTRLESRERTQRVFASEAIELAQRIRRGARGSRREGDPGPPRTAEEARLEELARDAERLEALREESTEA